MNAQPIRDMDMDIAFLAGQGRPELFPDLGQHERSKTSQ
jgi:hypothetical protein